MSSVIPDEIARFLEEIIDSVAELEGLLLLRKDPEMKWDARTLAGRLYIGESETEELLSRLCQNGLVTAEGGEPVHYRYAPASSDMRALVDRVVELYSRHLAPVAKFIHSRPRSRVQGFADAFKLRKDG